MQDIRSKTSSGAISQAPTLAPSSISLKSFEKECESAFTTPKASSESSSSSRTVRHIISALSSKGEEEKQDAKSNVETREDGTLYPTRLKLGIIVLAICMSILLMGLDNAIITTAIPKITDNFHSLPDVGWYGSGYMITAASLQLFFGKLYTYLSVKWVFLAAVSIFELGSLICGIAPNSLVLIMGRAIAGLGCAGLMTGGLLVLAHSVPLARRPFYNALIGSMYGVASVAGPLMGGIFTDKVSWRWCFFINLPFGALTIAIVVLIFPDPPRPLPKEETFLQRLRHFDPIGTLVFMPAIVCLLLALQWGTTAYSWSDGRVVSLLVIAGGLLVTFAALQYLGQENATVPPRIMRQRTVLSCGTYSFCLGGAFFVLCYYIPMWFQAVQGVSAVDSGIRNLPMLISVVAASMAAGAVVSWLGYYAPFMVAGTAAMSAGAGLLVLFKPNTGPAAWIGYQILFGAGVGLGMQQPLMAVQTVLGSRDVATGTSVINFLQTLGGAIFVSTSQAIFNDRLVRDLSSSIPGLDPARVLASGATNIRHAVAPEHVPQVVKSYNRALVSVFLVAAGLAAATAFGAAAVEWRSVKGEKKKVAATMADTSGG